MNLILKRGQSSCERNCQLCPKQFFCHETSSCIRHTPALPQAASNTLPLSPAIFRAMALAGREVSPSTISHIMLSFAEETFGAKCLLSVTSAPAIILATSAVMAAGTVVDFWLEGKSQHQCSICYRGHHQFTYCTLTTSIDRISIEGLPHSKLPVQQSILVQ